MTSVILCKDKLKEVEENEKRIQAARGLGLCSYRSLCSVRPNLNDRNFVQSRKTENLKVSDNHQHSCRDITADTSVRDIARIVQNDCIVAN